MGVAELGSALALNLSYGFSSSENIRQDLCDELRDKRSWSVYHVEKGGERGRTYDHNQDIDPETTTARLPSGKMPVFKYVVEQFEVVRRIDDSVEGHGESSSGGGARRVGPVVEECRRQPLPREVVDVVDGLLCKLDDRRERMQLDSYVCNSGLSGE